MGPDGHVCPVAEPDPRQRVRRGGELRPVHLRAMRRGVVHECLSGERDRAGSADRRQGGHRRAVHRLPPVHDRLSVRHRVHAAAVRQGREVQSVRRATGVRRRLSRRRRSCTASRRRRGSGSSPGARRCIATTSTPSAPAGKSRASAGLTPRNTEGANDAGTHGQVAASRPDERPDRGRGHPVRLAARLCRRSRSGGPLSLRRARCAGGPAVARQHADLRHRAADRHAGSLRRPLHGGDQRRADQRHHHVELGRPLGPRAEVRRLRHGDPRRAGAQAGLPLHSRRSRRAARRVAVLGPAGRRDRGRPAARAGNSGPARGVHRAGRREAGAFRLHHERQAPRRGAQRRRRRDGLEEPQGHRGARHRRRPRGGPARVHEGGLGDARRHAGQPGPHRVHGTGDGRHDRHDPGFRRTADAQLPGGAVRALREPERHHRQGNRGWSPTRRASPARSRAAG